MPDRIGYVPHGPGLDRPFDRRRFPRYAACRGIDFTVVDAWSQAEVVVLSPAADLTYWVGAPGGVRVVYDLPDAYLAEARGLHRMARGTAKWVSGELRRPVASYRNLLLRMLRRADAVVCSTADQQGALEAFNGNVHPVLDLLQEVPILDPAVPPGGILEILWEGLPATMSAIDQVLPALRRLQAERPIVLHLVTDLVSPRYANRFRSIRTADVAGRWGIPVEVHQWSLDTLTEVASRCSVAIVPVEMGDALAVGKPENRVRIHWRLGLPVLASASPSNVRAAGLAGVADEVICRRPEDWEVSIRRIAADPQVGHRLVDAGRSALDEHYSLESLLLRWDRVMASVGIDR